MLGWVGWGPGGWREAGGPFDECLRLPRLVKHGEGLHSHVPPVQHNLPVGMAHSAIRLSSITPDSTRCLASSST